MEIILYVTGGLALLALAWLFISLANTVSAVKVLLGDVRGDVAQMVSTVNEVKDQVVPILSNVNQITSNVTGMTANIEKQLIHVQETIDDALDIVRGTLDDVERIKDQVVSTVEGPVSLVHDVSDGALGAIAAGLRMVKKFVGKKNSNSRF
jgi:methyl-accepting chemotaxis protein